MKSPESRIWIGGELGGDIVPAQVRRADQSTLVRWELAATATFASDDGLGAHSTKA